MAEAFRKLALSSSESLPLSRLCANTPPSQRKNPPHSGQPNRLPYIGKHELHSWWKKLTRNPVTWLTLHTPEWLRVSQLALGLVAVQRDLCDLIKIIFILAVCKTGPSSVTGSQWLVFYIMSCDQPCIIWRHCREKDQSIECYHLSFMFWKLG